MYDQDDAEQEYFTRPTAEQENRIQLAACRRRLATLRRCGDLDGARQAARVEELLTQRMETAAPF
jgi:hypothetical protein